MIITTRAILLLISTLLAAVIVHGFSLDDDDLFLSTRDLGLDEYSDFTARGYVEEGSVVLSARDLEDLGVREVDIDAIFARGGRGGGGRSRTQSPAGHGHTKAECEREITKFRNAIAGNEAIMQRARRVIRDRNASEKDKAFQQKEYDSAKELKDGNQEQLDFWQDALRSAK